jgi:uncharacterized membrane protein HdeD (DUF308 family)
MPDEKKPDARPWWMTARFHGLIIMFTGIAMLFNPITAPVASTVITVGAGWATAGTVSKITRDKYAEKP